MDDMKSTFAEFKKELNSINQISDLNPDNITAMWVVAIYSTIG